MDTWRFYNGRADSENRLKELKEDFGADGFCLQSFDGAEVAFRLIWLLFNLIADFKREVTRDESPRLMTLRSQVLVVGAILGAEGRKAVLGWVFAAAGASASPPSSRVSPPWRLQLWRSLLTRRNDDRSPPHDPGNPAALICEQPPYSLSIEVFGLSRFGGAREAISPEVPALGRSLRPIARGALLCEAR